MNHLDENRKALPNNYTVSFAVLYEGGTWDQIDYKVEALNESKAKEIGLQMAEMNSDIGCACFLGIWQGEEGEEE